MKLGAPTKTRRWAIAIMIKEARGEILMIKSLRKQGTSKEASNLHAKVSIRTIVSYLTHRIGFLLLRKVRKILGDLTA